MHLRVKKLNLENFNHAVTDQNLPRVLIIPSRQREINNSTRYGFFENLFPQAEREGVKICDAYVFTYLSNLSQP